VQNNQAVLRDEGNDALATTAANEALAKLPMNFESNKGQAEDGVKFVSRGNGFALLLKQGEAILALRARQNAHNELNDGSSSTSRLSMKLENANPAPVVSGVEQQQAVANYFIGNNPAKWIKGIETYSRVLYSDVYPGVDLTFRGNQRQLEYDFTLASGADVNGIRLKFDGAGDIEISREGALILSTPAGDVRHERPIAYQDNNGARLRVPADFKRLEDGSIGFEVGDYDASRPLVIDPMLVYSTYLGGGAADVGRGIAVDAAGNTFLVGNSFSSDFLFQSSTTNSDLFIGKLNSAGTLLTYTYVVASKNDIATGIALDSTGKLYICGTTESPDFPFFNSVGLALRGPSDVFVIKLSPTLDQFFYLSLIGGSGEEAGPSVAVDTAGSAYISGRTSSADFPTASAIQPVYGGGDSDAFVAKLAPDGKSLVYSTFLGGSGTEDFSRQSGISVDASGNAYVAGDTQSTNFPTKNALRAAKTGSAASFDGFVAKINPAGSDFVYSTYMGGSGDDFALAIDNDSSGNAYVTGRTISTSFTGSTATRPSTATTDAFVAKLNASGAAISYLTFVGGVNGDESANAITVDADGNAVIAGTAGTGVLTVNSIQSFFKGGVEDAFVAKLGPTGVVTFSTYLGGSGDDAALGVGVDGTGAIYIIGFTDSTDLLTAAALRRTNAGARDILIAKIDPSATPNSPVLLHVEISGKNLIVFGDNFDIGAVLLINDVAVKTRNEDPDPTQVLFAKKAAKQIASGQVVQLQVENPNGKRSDLLFLTKP